MKYKLFLALLTLLLFFILYNKLFTIKEGTSRKCAEEGGLCKCEGEVQYGSGQYWTKPRQVDGSIQCTESNFYDPAAAVKWAASPLPKPAKKLCICTSTCLFCDKPVSDQAGVGGSGKSATNSLGGLGKGAPFAAVAPCAEQCRNTTMYENVARMKEANEKLSELKKIVEKTEASVNKNTSETQKNDGRAVNIQRAADGEARETTSERKARQGLNAGTPGGGSGSYAPPPSSSDRDAHGHEIDSDDDACDIHSEACGVDPNDNVEARIGRAQGISARSSGAMQTPWS